MPPVLMGDPLMRRFLLAAALIALLLPGLTHAGDNKPRFAGPTDKGFLLPNGWHLTPAGKHVLLTDLPLNIVALRDGRHA